MVSILSGVGRSTTKAAHAGFGRHAISSTWKVLVSIASFGMGVAVEGKVVEAVRRLVRPCVPLVSTQGEVVYHALFSTRGMAALREVETRFLRAAKLKSVHFDRDGATSNSRAVEARFGSVRASAEAAGGTVLLSDMTCGSHRTQLVFGALLSILA